MFNVDSEYEQNDGDITQVNESTRNQQVGMTQKGWEKLCGTLVVNKKRSHPMLRQDYYCFIFINERRMYNDITRHR